MKKVMKNKVVGFILMSGVASAIIGIGARKQIKEASLNVQKRLEAYEANKK